MCNKVYCPAVSLHNVGYVVPALFAIPCLSTSLETKCSTLMKPSALLNGFESESQQSGCLALMRPAAVIHSGHSPCQALEGGKRWELGRDGPRSEEGTPRLYQHYKRWPWRETRLQICLLGNHVTSHISVKMRGRSGLLTSFAEAEKSSITTSASQPKRRWQECP